MKSGIDSGIPKLSAGEQKVEEYVKRITEEGESKESIYQGLTPFFISSIEEKLNDGLLQQEQVTLDDVPPQYKGMHSEALDFIWDIPEYADIGKTERLRERKKKILTLLRQKESEPETVAIQATENTVSVPTEKPALSIEERKKLRGWPASFALADIAKSEGLDLSTLSREEYAHYAIQNSLAIDDSQLRTATWQRMESSMDILLSKRKHDRSRISETLDMAFEQFCSSIKQKARQENRFLSEGVRVRQGTKDSNSWLFFGINNGIDEESNETYKSYVSLKDLNTLTPKRFTEFMEALQKANYNGDTKIFQEMKGQGTSLNDQIVIHGATEADAELGLQIARSFFAEDVHQCGMGKDEVIDGKNRSYSQILAQKIFEEIQKNSTNPSHSQ